MRKIFFFFIIVLFANSISFAQEFGFKGGLSLANIYGEDRPDIDDDQSNPFKPGFNFAGFFRFGEGPFRYTVEAGFSQKGTLIKYPETSENLGSYKPEQLFNLNYMDINAFGNYFISNRVSLDLGLGISFLINGQAKQVFNATGVYADLIEDSSNPAVIGEDVTGLDLGVKLGASFYINEKIHADAHYYLGFLTLDPDNNSDFDPDKMFNNAIMISFGYKFLNTSLID